MAEYRWVTTNWNNLGQQAWLLWNGCLYELNDKEWILAPYTITTTGSVLPI